MDGPSLLGILVWRMAHENHNLILCMEVRFLMFQKVHVETGMVVI